MPGAPKLFGGNPRYERWRWQIFGVTWLAYAGFYLTRKSFSVAKIELAKPDVMGLSDGDLARIDGAFSDSVCHRPIRLGNLRVDKFGARRVVLGGMLGSVIAALAMGASSFTAAFGVLFFIQGLCQSTGWAPLSKNLGNFFSRRERGVVMGAWCFELRRGGIDRVPFRGCRGRLVRLALRVFHSGAHAARHLGAVPVTAARPARRCRPTADEAYHNEKPDVPLADEATHPEPEGSWKVIVDVLRNPMVLLLAAIYFLLKPARYAILFWGPKYIHDKLGGGMTTSGFVSAMFELAGVFQRDLWQDFCRTKSLARAACRCPSFTWPC
jgi:OPA family sugar phosphate sensor protein UhpC-like MFS transporter